MQSERIAGLIAVVTLGAMALFSTARVLAFPPGGGGPACDKAIEIVTSMTDMSGSCSTYTDCDDRHDCVDGAVYNNCGSPGLVDGYCGDYELGTWDSQLGRYVGGQLVNGQYTWNGMINGFPSPVVCE